jgi:RNA polymerase sigma-70 factor (sigma-E family)
VTGDAGREDAFVAFVTVRSAALTRTAFLLTGDWGHAEDLVQTALAKTYLAWPRIRDTSAVEAYVRRTMVTTYTSWRRRRHWTAEIPTGEVAALGPATRTGPDDDPVPYEVMKALADLPRKQRAVLVLRYCEDLGIDEVARLLHLPVGSVKSSGHRGLQTLRTRLSADRPSAATGQTLTSDAAGGTA